MDERLRYRAVIGHFATGVAVVTGQGEDGPGGMTASALCSLSLDPLLLLVCFDNTARTLPMVRDRRRFAVNVLEAAQTEVSHVFASKLPEREKFDGIPYEMRDGVPVLEGTLAWLVCDVRELIPGGDHTIAIGQVRQMHHGEGEPLLWYRGDYRSLDAARA